MTHKLKILITTLAAGFGFTLGFTAIMSHLPPITGRTIAAYAIVVSTAIYVYSFTSEP